MADVGLQEAGVDLKAKNIRTYLKELRAVDKAQQKAFQQNMRQSTAALARFTQQLDKATQSSKRFAQQAKNTSASQQGVFASLRDINQSGIPDLIAKLGLASFELAKNTANFKAQQTGLDNLAASYGQVSGDIVQAMQEASRGVLSSSDIILSANKALLLDVAKTPEEFANMTRSAIVLGRTMGLDATTAIEKFTIALGRKSFPILDDFGIKAAQVTVVMEKMAQAQFGVELKGLDIAAKDALFMAATLEVAAKRVEQIGTETGKAAESFDRLNAQSENLKLVLGEAILPSMLRFVETTNQVVVSAQKAVAVLSAGTAQINAFLGAIELPDLQQMFAGGQLGIIKGLANVVTEGIFDPEKFEEAAEKGQEAFNKRFKELARPLGISFPGDEATTGIDASTEAMIENAEAAEEDAKEIEQLGQAIKQAEKLSISFARAQENAARKLNRQQAKQGKAQRKERDVLLKRQAKELDKFEADRRGQIANAEAEIRKERKAAADQQRTDQKRLHQQLKQAQERFDLTKLQSQRRFQLQDTRLRAAGDILGLQQLREDFALQQKEAKENFDLNKGQTKEGAKLTQQEQAKDLDTRIAELKSNLEKQRAELLTGFDEELALLQESQSEQRAQTLENFAEQQEDARISQRRQLEDLGRSLAEQTDVTQEGAESVANELETIFGQDGVASTIMDGFAARTNSEFETLFKSVEQILEDINKITPRRFAPTAPSRDTLGTGIPTMHEGGTVPGPIGAERPIIALGGEQVLPIGTPAHGNANMSTPAIPSQTLAVEFSGEVGITGGESNPEAVGAAADLITEELAAAVTRLTRGS